MCWEDIKIGRASSGIVSTKVAVLGAAVQLCGYNLSRTRLIISVAAAGIHFFSTNSVASATNFALRAESVEPTVILRVEDWGELITRAWWGLSDQSNQRYTTVEISIKDKP